MTIRGGRLGVGFLLALVVPALPASAAPSCLGKPATHVMHEGDGPFALTSSSDVVVGSSGADQVDLGTSGGIDFVCGNGGNDTLNVANPGSIADGGAGRDKVYASNGATARGGAGDDEEIVASGAGGRAEGGSGGDVVQANDGAIGDGGSGNDNVQGSFAAVLLGGSGGDFVFNVNGDPDIDCGAAYDQVVENGATSVKRCEASIAPP